MALVVVFADLAIGFILFIMFIYLRAMQKITDEEINGMTVTAQDFALQLTNLPEHTNLRELKANMWSWLDNVLNKEKSLEVNPQTDIIDENQNNLMNLNLGLNDYGKLQFMLQMAELFKQKERYMIF